MQIFKRISIHLLKISLVSLVFSVIGFYFRVQPLFCMNIGSLVAFVIAFDDVYGNFLFTQVLPALSVCSLLVIFAIFVLFIKNPIYSIINFILVYLCASIFLVLLEIPFLAIIFILVYLGAVVVLFLFIVMMLNVKVVSSVNIRGFIFACVIVCLFVCGYFFFLDAFCDTYKFFYFVYDKELVDFFSMDYRGVNYIAFVLYSYYRGELMLGAVILLLAMVGCIAISYFSLVCVIRTQDQMSQVLSSHFLFLRADSENCQK